MYEKKIFKLSEKENKRVLTILNKIKERYNYTNSDMAKKIDMDYNAFYRMMKGQQLVMRSPTHTCITEVAALYRFFCLADEITWES